MYSVQLQYCWHEMKTTGINHIIYPEEQSFRKTTLLEGCLPSDCLFCKIFTFFFFVNVLFMLQQPVEMKANYPWKEVHKLFTALCTESQAYLLEGKKKPGCQGADGSGAEPAEPGPSKVCWALVTGSHMWCHFQLPGETDAPRSISLSSIKDLLLSHRVFFNQGEQHNSFIPSEPAGASRVFPLLLVKGVNKGLAGDWDSYFWKTPSAKKYYGHFDLIKLFVGID